MKTFFIIIFLLYGNGNLLVSVIADHHDLCRVLKDGSQFRRPGSCDEYVTCTNQTGYIERCPSPLKYDRNRKRCVATISDCRRNYCANVNASKWVANPDNCNGFFFCNKSVAHTGFCPGNYHFDENQQSCVFRSVSGCNDVSNICEFLPDKTMLRDETDCTVYYQCVSGKKSKTTCKNKYFDISKGACVNKNLVACTAHPLPTNICGTKAKPQWGFKTDAATCRGYFYCKNLGKVRDTTPVWGQCPAGQFFNTSTSSCVDPINAHCIYNRCEGRGNRMVVSSRNNCRNYIVCRNGLEMEERSCNGDKFFDEHMQACVHNVITYPCCDGKI